MLGGATTDRTIGVDPLMLPAFPVTVIVVLPSVADPEAVSVSVEFTDPFAGGVTGLGLKAAVTPEGSPPALNVVAALNPPKLVTVIVLAAFLP